ncbi:hypothetical protein M422DRAFT_31414 [Sphaerobolus stellatus SS14]|uniref:Uncharacterized protein n=1 Tax=Sphaerobolus stellatus (strain SS14) TaxID=990650 RepID=A0A0C9VUJ3_SPHS4|nr:hypothetical protein M422DRAFT_31414 [Sphaerobolus stellatus SS14]
MPQIAPLHRRRNLKVSIHIIDSPLTTKVSRTWHVTHCIILFTCYSPHQHHPNLFYTSSLSSDFDISILCLNVHADSILLALVAIVRRSSTTMSSLQ